MDKKQINNRLKIILVLMVMFMSLINCIDQDNKASQNQLLLKEKNLVDQQMTQNFINSTYKLIPNSSQYYRQFASQLSKILLSETVNVTHLSNGKQICINGMPCEFYYYVIKPKFDPEKISSFSINGNDYIKNVLFVAGMHGNQYLGPMSLLYAIRHLETPSTRIIIFPLANPSGFDHKQRLTFPTNLDPNRDFPIEQYTFCYQTTSSLIIDHIYRKYHIDLTLALHNGRSQIGWNWGTMRQKYNSKTVDQVIYKDIGQFLKFVGGKNKDISMDQFKIGTMNEVVYPVKGGFQDWAYAASWYNASQGKKPTQRCPFSQYPFNMTNGLVFLFELGPFQVNQKLFGSQEGLYVNPSTRELSNGYISRAIRMFSGLMKIPNPRLELRFTNEKIVINLLGCKTGVIDKLKISNKQVNREVYYQSKYKLSIQGNINNKTIQPMIIQLQKQFFTDDDMKKYKFDKLETKDLVVQYNLVCDPQWQGRGQTVFGQKRQFNISQTLLLSPQPTTYTSQTLFPSLVQALSNSHKFNTSQTSDDQSFYEKIFGENSETLMIIIILILVTATVFCVIWVVFREIRKDMKARRVQRLKKKLQKISQDSSIQDIGPYQSAEITLSDIKINKQEKNNNQKKTKKPVESYPQMCESDKSMKTEDLDSSRSHNI